MEYSAYKSVVTLTRLFILPFFTGLGVIGIYKLHSHTIYSIFN